MYKTVALQRMLIGESKGLFEVWKLEGLSFDNTFIKLKEYARGVRLDGDASKGMRAVNMNWSGQTQEEEEKGGAGSCLVRFGYGYSTNTVPMLRST